MTSTPEPYTRPTERDIQKTRDGYYFLNCDGRHSPDWHKYLYYTKKEVMRLWRREHPRKEES